VSRSTGTWGVGWAKRWSRWR